jgi:hypothetical protein
MEETRLTGEKHRPVASHCIEYTSPWTGFELTTLVWKLMKYLKLSQNWIYIHLHNKLHECIPKMCIFVLFMLRAIYIPLFTRNTDMIDWLIDWLEDYIWKVFSVWILFLLLSHVICLCKSLLLTSCLLCMLYWKGLVLSYSYILLTF